MIDFTGCKVLVNSYEGADFKRRRRMNGKIEYREKKDPAESNLRGLERHPCPR